MPHLSRKVAKHVQHQGELGARERAFHRVHGDAGVAGDGLQSLHIDEDTGELTENVDQLVQRSQLIILKLTVLLNEIDENASTQTDAVVRA